MNQIATKTKEMPNMWRVWLMAMRLRTLPIAIIQALVGAGLAFAFIDKVDGIRVLCTTLIAIFITIGTNLINDALDFKKGGDPLNRFGHLKVIRAGFLTEDQVYIAGMLAFLIAILLSIPLSLASGWLFSFLVVLSAVFGYCYTGGPYPISYLGLSELFILIFYGIVCVCASFYAQTGKVNMEAILCALQMGLLAVIPNAVNNFRDMFEDASVNKRTLAVRFGKYFAKWEIALLTSMPFLLNIGWLILGYQAAFFMPWLLIPIAFSFIRGIWLLEPGPVFNRYFGLSVGLHFLFGTLLVIGWQC